MTDHRFVADMPALDAPTLIVMLSGWIDASEAAASTMKTLQDDCDATPLVEFDGDQYIDYRARRPVMELRDGVNTALDWQSIDLRSGRDLTGHDVVLLSGPEPDMYWHRFADTIGSLAVSLKVSKMVGLGAYPYAVPHTRATRLSITTPSTQLRDRFPTARTSIDLPAGMTAVLEHALHDREIPAFSLWAQVPHYVASMSYPPASVALIDGLREYADIVVDGAEVRQDALDHRQQIDRLIEGNAEHQAMVHQLEQIYDADDDDSATTPGSVSPDGLPGARDGLRAGDLPSADELAGEIERFLRDEGKNP